MFKQHVCLKNKTKGILPLLFISISILTAKEFQEIQIYKNSQINNKRSKQYQQNITLNLFKLPVNHNR